MIDKLPFTPAAKPSKRVYMQGKRPYITTKKLTGLHSAKPYNVFRRWLMSWWQKMGLEALEEAISKYGAP